MLALAQKLHDDYVRSGQEEGDRLISEAKSRRTRIVREAEETSHRTLSQLEQERVLLERKIDELRVFERDYRTRLKSYLENLLGDLDNRGSALPPRAGQRSRRGAPAASDGDRPGAASGQLACIAAARTTHHAGTRPAWCVVRRDQGVYSHVTSTRGGARDDHQRRDQLDDDSTGRSGPGGGRQAVPGPRRREAVDRSRRCKEIAAELTGEIERLKSELAGRGRGAVRPAARLR